MIRQKMIGTVTWVLNIESPVSEESGGLDDGAIQ